MMTTFAPELFIPHGIKDIAFYSEAFGALEHRRFTNDDGSIHVAELSVNGSIFHLHEEKTSTGNFCPERVKGITAIIGLFVPDVDLLMARSLKAGARLLSPATDYDYGYRQGQVQDPFGHTWMIQSRIGTGSQELTGSKSPGAA